LPGQNKDKTSTSTNTKQILKKGNTRRHRYRYECVCMWLCGCGIVVAVYHMWALRREVCNMQMQMLLAGWLPLLWPFYGASFVNQVQVVFVLLVHLLQTLILFMLHCSGVNNFISNCRTAVSVAVFHSRCRFQKPLALLMTHDTCPGLEKLSMEFVSSFWRNHTHNDEQKIGSNGPCLERRSDEIGTFSPMKLALTWAITTHKCYISCVTEDSQKLGNMHLNPTSIKYIKILIYNFEGMTQY